MAKADDMLLENVAEICFLGGSFMRQRHSRWEDVESQEITSALIEAAEALTAYEKKHGRDELWAAHDWMLTTEEIAQAVIVHGEDRIRVGDIPKYLQAH